VTPQEKRIGPGSLAGIGEMLRRLQPRKVMLVTGGRSYTHSGASDRIEPALSGLEVIRFAGVSANPRIDAIDRGVSMWQSERPNVIVAAGGGSVLDVAKLVSLLGPRDQPPHVILGDEAALENDGVPLLAIPTTAGSGAEATRFATFYSNGEKQSLSHPLLRPSHVIVDPLLTASMPAEVAAATALDALAQAIESFWAVGATPESQALAEAALREVLPCLPGIVRAPTAWLRERMAYGAHLAGQAIDISRTTAAHALSYALTSDMQVPHGHAAALLLPSIFRINAQPGGRGIRDPRGTTYVAEILARLLDLLDCPDSETAARFLEDKVAAVGLATRLTTPAPDALAAQLARKVNAERLHNNPVAISDEDALRVYRSLLVHGAAA